MKNENIKSQLPTWIALEADVIICKNLNSTDKVLYALICALSNNSEKRCSSHNNYFSKVLGITTRQVQRSLMKLKENNLIKIEIENGFRRYITTSINAYLKYRQAKTKLMSELNKEINSYDWLNDV